MPATSAWSSVSCICRTPAVNRQSGFTSASIRRSSASRKRRSLRKRRRFGLCSTRASKAEKSSGTGRSARLPRTPVNAGRVSPHCPASLRIDVCNRCSRSSRSSRIRDKSTSARARSAVGVRPACTRFCTTATVVSARVTASSARPTCAWCARLMRNSRAVSAAASSRLSSTSDSSRDRPARAASTRCSRLPRSSTQARLIVASAPSTPEKSPLPAAFSRTMPSSTFGRTSDCNTMLCCASTW